MPSSVVSWFAPVSDDAALQALVDEHKGARAVLSLVHPREADELSKEKLVAPLAFLLHRREADLALVQAPGASFALHVYKDGAQTATLALEGSLEERAVALAAQIGWSPDCPAKEELGNYLSPIDAEELLSDVDAYTTGQRDCFANTANVSSIIWHAFVAANRPINWAGFYFVRPLANPKPSDHNQILILGPFMGKPACTRIRFQSGVCGAAARTKTVQRIADVHQFEGHIACDGASESEIVVPVFDKQGEVIAVLDLDCPEKHGFSAEDQRTLVEVARIVSERSDWHNLTLPYTQ